ncbi:hypothetical protein GCK32_001505 [Trichostrongylus colubriformis]|uniref:EGF-like domain-containing protein n=1 Tax=Trichostrongylus colubriformis TaxID=6319 RepID=A0AAN8FIF2_TRICO
MLSTTDSQLLDIFLKQPPVEKVNRTAPPEAPYDALLLGMSTQLTARALVMLVSRGGDFPIAESFVKQLSLERAELRVFTEQASSNFTTLAMLGNGIPFVVSRDDFQQVYFPSYVVPIAAKATSLSSPVFNVIASDVSCNATIVIPAEDYSLTITLFAHVSSSNGATVEVQQGGSQPSPTRIGNSTYKFTIQSKVMANISIRGSGQCSYSVEALNYYKIGYVFQKNNLDESGFVGPVQGLNYVSLSAANSLSNSDLSMMPLIQLRPITRNGTLGNAVLTTTTAKSSACTYSYFAELNCTQDLFGYQAQIQTSLAPNTRRQQQVIMTCLQLDSCKNGGQLKEGACVCDGWSGAECELPLCMNGGTRDGSVCICSANTFGELCEQKVPTHLNMVFILDSVGLDDTAFNSSITSILEFVSLYDIGNLRLMLIDNAKALPLNDGFVTYTTEALYSKLTGLFSYRNSMATIELDTVFSNISMQAKREQLTSAPNNFVFYVTQSGGKVQDLTSLADLRRSFTVSCIAISAYNQTLPSSVLDDLKQIGYTKTADNWYTAMKEMQGVTGSEDKQPPTQPPQPRCAGKQMSIFFAVDLSPGVDTYRDKMLAILNMFPTAFNLGYDILSGNTGCNEDGDITAAYSGSSRISGWSYYDRWLGVSNPTFCISNLASVMKSTQYDIGDDPVPTINGTKGLLKRFTTLLTNTCLCSRYNDTSVTKAVIWMPIANYTFDGYTDLLNTPYVHYVIPLSFQPQEGDFYYGLSQNNGKMDGLLHGAESSTSDSIVNDLWSILCG